LNKKPWKKPLLIDILTGEEEGKVTTGVERLDCAYHKAPFHRNNTMQAMGSKVRTNYSVSSPCNATFLNMMGRKFHLTASAIATYTYGLS